jgi:hypothetical protein
MTEKTSLPSGPERSTFQAVCYDYERRDEAEAPHLLEANDFCLANSELDENGAHTLPSNESQGNTWESDEPVELVDFLCSCCMRGRRRCADYENDNQMSLFSTGKPVIEQSPMYIYMC